MRRWINGDGPYLAIGLMVLLIASLITVGAMFSSYAVALGAGLLIDLPIGLGLVGVPNRRLATCLMILGCSLIVTYIVVVTYFSMKRGYPMLAFHKVWAVLCFAEIALSLFRLRQLRQTNGATPWQQ